MNRVLVLPPEIGTGRSAIVTGERAKRLYGEFGLRAGAECPVAVLGGRLGRGKVVSAEPHAVVLELSSFEPRPPRLDLELIVGYARPQIFKRVLLNAILAGVSRLHFVRSVRVEKSYLKSTVLEMPRLLAEITYGLEQAEDAVPPEICFEDSLGRFLHGRFPEIVEQEGAERLSLFVADTAANGSLPLEGGLAPGPVFLAIGPEAGWVESERDLFSRGGFTSISFGPRTLRVDTAVLYGTAQIALVRERTPKPLSSPR